MQPKKGNNDTKLISERNCTDCAARELTGLPEAPIPAVADLSGSGSARSSHFRWIRHISPFRACLAALLLLFVLPVNEAIGQEERPVSWTLELADTAGSDSVVFRLGAQIDQGWYLYAPTQPAVGPYPMEVSVAAGGGWQMAGDLVAPRPHRLPDRTFGIISEVYRDSPDFFLPVMPVDGDSGAPIEVLVLYQPCTGTYCLPPRTDTLHWAVAVKNVSAGLESAIAHVKYLYFALDFHHGTAVGEAALERWPDSSELALWTLSNLSSSSGYSSAGAYEAVARAESLVKSQPVDVWSAIALAHAMSNVFERHIEALKASRRALELAPTLPEAVWIHGFILHKHQQYQAAADLIEEKWPVVDRQWPELLTIKGNTYLVGRVGVEEHMAEGLKILAEVRELDPENVNAYYLAGIALIENPQRIAEGAALLERAAELSPRSFGIARSNWWAISRYPGLNAEEKLTLIRASAKELIAQQGNYPGLISSVAIELSNPWFAQQAELKALLKVEGIKYGDRMLKEYADTEHAEAVLMDRSRWLFEDLYFGVVEDTVAARAELSSMWWSFINRPNRPNHHQTRLLGEAYMSLFDHLRRDETVSGDTLLLLAHGAMENAHYHYYVRLANGLAERGVHLDTARLIAREGIEAADDYISNFYYARPGDKANRLNRTLGDAYSALGHVEMKASDLLAAREATDRALELNSKDLWVQFRAGALAEAEGNMKAAESHYALGEREERFRRGWRGDKPNTDALERIYTARHGAMTGFEEYIVGIVARDRDRRRQLVADTRIAEPRDLPAIDLKWLDGGRIGADELEGRIVVINFWGVWCGPCVAEAPQIQQLHEKYRDDPGVVFLTINAFDPNLDEVRSWMAENEYDWPVLVNDNFVNRYGVNVYPTTWFAGRDGRIVFEYSGASAAVFEEFVWRVEMLQAEGGS